MIATLVECKGIPVERYHEIAMPLDLLPEFVRANYEHKEWRHACAILRYEYEREWDDIMNVLHSFRIPMSQLVVGGGNKSQMSKYIDSHLYDCGWEEKRFDTKVVVDQNEMSSPTHSVDCYKNGIALEIEWNNKDPFFDRDLNNFRLLFDLRTVHVGVIVTRADELQGVFDSIGRGKSFGRNTTHWDKLIPRIEGGGGGGCPILALGIKPSLVVDDRNQLPAGDIAAALSEGMEDGDEDRD
jgi:hypothetical protein